MKFDVKYRDGKAKEKRGTFCSYYDLVIKLLAMAKNSARVRRWEEL